MMELLQIPARAAHLEITEALAEAVSEAAKLPVADQNYLANRIMAEIAEEHAADEPQENLAFLLAQAQAEYERGETKPMSKNCVIAND